MLENDILERVGFAVSSNTDYMGITSVAKEGQRLFQQIFQKTLNCCSGTDILIWSKNTREHNRILDMVLGTLEENNLTTVQHKSIFRSSMVLWCPIQRSDELTYR